MQVLKTTVKLRPGVNPWGKGWFSGWVISKNSRVVSSSPSLDRWLGCEVGEVIHAIQCMGGTWKSEWVDESP